MPAASSLASMRVNRGSSKRTCQHPLTLSDRNVIVLDLCSTSIDTLSRTARKPGSSGVPYKWTLDALALVDVGQTCCWSAADGGVQTGHAAFAAHMHCWPTGSSAVSSLSGLHAKKRVSQTHSRTHTVDTRAAKNARRVAVERAVLHAVQAHMRHIVVRVGVRRVAAQSLVDTRAHGQRTLARRRNAARSSRNPPAMSARRAAARRRTRTTSRCTRAPRPRAKARQPRAPPATHIEWSAAKCT